MNKELKDFESTLKKKHSFGWTPKYEEEFRTGLPKTVFVPIVLKTFEQLGWDLVFQDETSAEAKRRGSWDNWTEKISVVYEYGKVTVKSVALGNEWWDNGSNSKRVQLFKYAFQQTEKEYDKKSIAELEQEVERKNNWDDYEIPEQLPQPKAQRKPQIWIPIVGGILTALILGLAIAFFSINGFYILLLFEVGVAIAIGFALYQLIKLSNYTNYDYLHYVMIGMILIIYISSQYFQYLMLFHDIGLDAFSFWGFIQERFRAGLTIKTLNTGWIGMVIMWVLQLVITYFVGLVRLASYLTHYQLNKVPMEVVDFAYYHFVKDKSEDEVRNELSRMGWIKTQDQDEVFQSIGALQGVMELDRME